MYEYRVRAIGNDAEAEGYLNNMAQERWALKFCVLSRRYESSAVRPPTENYLRTSPQGGGTRRWSPPVNMRPSGHTVHVSGSIGHGTVATVAMCSGSSSAEPA